MTNAKISKDIQRCTYIIQMKQILEVTHGLLDAYQGIMLLIS